MKFLYKKINNFFYKLFFLIINIYQKIISPILPARCRYYPTCSAYGKQALAWHGAWRGGWLLLKRIARCHPLGGHGIDFVPLPLASYHYTVLPRQAVFSSGFGVYKDRTSYSVRLNEYLRSS